MKKIKENLLYNKDSKFILNVVNRMIEKHIYPNLIKSLFEIKLKRIHQYNHNHYSLIEDYMDLSKTFESDQIIEPIEFMEIFGD